MQKFVAATLMTFLFFGLCNCMENNIKHSLHDLFDIANVTTYSKEKNITILVRHQTRKNKFESWAMQGEFSRILFPKPETRNLIKPVIAEILIDSMKQLVELEKKKNVEFSFKSPKATPIKEALKKFWKETNIKGEIDNKEKEEIEKELIELESKRVVKKESPLHNIVATSLNNI